MKHAQWTALARIDLADLDDYYRPDDPDLADRIGDAAFAASRFLADHPRAGSLLGEGVERKWRVVRTPYILIYRPLLQTIQVLRVVHGATNWREDWP